MNQAINSLTYAYIGDAVYEIYIREYLIKQGIVKVKELQEKATKYVSAKGQAAFIKKLLEQNFLDKDEIEIVTRARNHKTNSHPKNTDIITYKYATSLEALIGYLYLNKKTDRIDEVMNYVKGE